ncbi:MAG: metallophosphoesterase family protein [Pseudomonadota bacterium]
MTFGDQNRQASGGRGAKAFAAALLGLGLLLGSCAHAHDQAGHIHEEPLQPPWQGATGWPDRIVVTLPKSPQTSFAVTWRTDSTVTETYAELVEARDDARFDLGAKRWPAQTEALDLQSANASGKVYKIKDNPGLPAAHFHSVVFDSLKPDTLYAYRVKGADAQWSEWLQTRTAAEVGPISFLYLGDAQNALRSHWARVIRAGFQQAPKADFVLHAGDLINRASRDLEWAEWFDAVGFIHGMIPAVPLAGNHEYEWLGLTAPEEDRFLSIHWRPQFTLPEEPELDVDLQEVVYDLRYSEDVHFFILSTQNTKIEAQAAWLDKELAKSDARWKILAMHHPIFSSGEDRDSPERRAALLPIIKKRGVDLVLQGHDHTYARGATSQTPERIAFKADGGDLETMFVNSVSGPKQYPFRDNGWSDYASDGVKLVRKGANTQFFQVITIDEGVLSYEAWTATGKLYDDFVMAKGPGGEKTITRGATSTMDERLFSNTGAYEKP